MKSCDMMACEAKWPPCFLKKSGLPGMKFHRSSGPGGCPLGPCGNVSEDWDVRRMKTHAG